MKVTPTLCGPAVTLNGMFWKRPLIGRDRRRLQLVDRLHVFLAADLPLEHLGAVDRRDERVPVLHAAHVPGDRETADVQLVLAVGGKQVLDQQPAARAQRQAFDVRALLGAARRTIGRAGRLRRRVANRPRADDAGGRDVLVEERRRHLQHARHVVEAVGLIVLREEDAGVDAQPEQVFDGVGVLGAIESMERDAARDSGSPRRPGRAVLEPRDQGVDRRLLRAAHAGRRHHAAAQLANRLFPDVRVVGQLREIQRVERDVRRSWCAGCDTSRSTDRAAHARETLERPRRRGVAGVCCGGPAARRSRSTQSTLRPQRNHSSRFCERCALCAGRRFMRPPA